MSEDKIIKFNMRELTEALVKHQGLTEGRWMLSAEFAIKAMNAGPNDQSLSPAALVPLISVGLNPAPEDSDNNLIVDAATLEN
ncbi:hypothetical protein MNBD_GAMMA12-3177 [hydrothermal vent metagenome]|uniref:Uncharacterized protein n=1 Tax=hydrothermal vent metagenome TaxID=652676 RepID=A0A3B0YP65_9ZZZZ